MPCLPQLADPQSGGIYAEVEQDGTVRSRSKAQNWKAACHDGRALLRTADRLRKLAENSVMSNSR